MTAAASSGASARFTPWANVCISPAVGSGTTSGGVLRRSARRGGRASGSLRWMARTSSSTTSCETTIVIRSSTCKRRIAPGGPSAEYRAETSTFVSRKTLGRSAAAISLADQLCSGLSSGSLQFFFGNAGAGERALDLGEGVQSELLGRGHYKRSVFDAELHLVADVDPELLADVTREGELSPRAEYGSRHGIPPMYDV